MKVEVLHIERRASYEDYPNQLAGTVQLKGDNGKMEVKLSMGTVARIFEVIKEDAAFLAKDNAGKTEAAIDNAKHEVLLDMKEIEDA